MARHKNKNKNKIECIHKPDTMLLIMLGVFKDLQTAVNERVDDVVWVLKRCVGECSDENREHSFGIHIDDRCLA